MLVLLNLFLVPQFPQPEIWFMHKAYTFSKDVDKTYEWTAHTYRGKWGPGHMLHELSALFIAATSSLHRSQMGNFTRQQWVLSPCGYSEPVFSLPCQCVDLTH